MVDSATSASLQQRRQARWGRCRSDGEIGFEHQVMVAEPFDDVTNAFAFKPETGVNRQVRRIAGEDVVGRGGWPLSCSSIQQSNARIRMNPP